MKPIKQRCVTWDFSVKGDTWPKKLQEQEQEGDVWDCSSAGDTCHTSKSNYGPTSKALSLVKVKVKDNVRALIVNLVVS